MADLPPKIQQLAQQDYDLSTIQSFLVLNLDEQPINVFHEDLNKVLTLDAVEGWQFLEEWAKDHNFSISRRGSKRAKIEILLGDIGNRHKLEQEAASSLNSILESAKHDSLPQNLNEISSSLSKAEKLQREQIKSLESRLFSPLFTSYYNSPLLKHIQNDDLRRSAALALAGNPSLASSYQSRSTPQGRLIVAETTKQIHHQLRQADSRLEPLLQELYSDAFEKDIDQTMLSVQNTLAEKYPGHSQKQIDLKELNSDISSFRQISTSLVTLTSLEHEIMNLPDNFWHAKPGEKEKFVKDLQKIVIASASGPNVSGHDLLTQLVKEGKLTPQAALNLQVSLAPKLEILQTAARTELIRATVTDRKRNRELFTQSLAESLGVNASIFWLKKKDLESATNYFLKEYGVDDLQKAINIEMANPKPDLQKYKNLIILQDKNRQFVRYHQARGGNPLFAVQDSLSKFNYNFRIVKEPYDIAHRRLFSTIYKVDDFINFVPHKTADFWLNLVDGKAKIGNLPIPTVSTFKLKNGSTLRVPWLNLPGFAVTQFGVMQKNLAISTFKWSYGLAQKGGVLGTIFRPISNYAFSFAQTGSFYESNFYFGKKAVGNFLNWGARSLGHESFAAMRTATGKAIFAFGNKVTGGLFSKGAAYLASLGLSVEGIGIVTTIALVAWDLLKAVGGFFKKLIKNTDGFRDKVLNWLPIAIGGAVAAIPAILAGIPGALAFGFTSLVAFLGLVLGGLAALFTQALLWGGSIVLGFMLFNNIAKTTMQIDPGLGLFTAIFCNDNQATADEPSDGGEQTSGQAGEQVGGNAVTQCADCLVKYLTACYGPTVEKNDFVNGIGCLVAQAVAPEVASIIQQSATSFTYLQCVGFVKASLACGGAPDIGPGNACNFIGQNAGGLKFVAGGSAANPGNICMLASKGGCSGEDPGHIFVVNSDKGAVVGASDANNALSCGASGCVTSGSVYPRSTIAGCLVVN